MRSPALKRAAAALRRERTADALDALLEAWADAPSPALATCIASASTVTRTEPPGLRGKTKAAIHAWSQIARAPRATEVPALLDAFADVLWRDAADRLSQMRAWRPDPRVDEAVVRLFETLPYRSTSRPFYVALAAQAARIRDPALLERIIRARARVGELMSPTLGDWLERRMDELIDDLRRRVTKPSAKHELREIENALENATRAAEPRGEIRTLLQAVYDEPDDTARRLVYADALLERGDVRGELITLQCQASLTPPQQRRERALVKEHGITWLGELSPIVMKGYRFERGFLADCTIDSNKATRIKPLVGHPAWSTVHTLADSALIALHPVMRSLRTLVFRPNRARNREELDDSWRELLAGTPRPIERLHFTDFDMYADRDDQLALLVRCDALPKLRELYVGGIATFYMNELLGSALAKRVDTIGLVFERYDDMPPELPAALRSGVVRRVVVQHAEMTLILERGAQGYERAACTVHGRSTLQATHVLRALPPTVRELRVATPPALDRGALVALSAASRALPNLEVREIG